MVVNIQASGQTYKQISEEITVKWERTEHTDEKEQTNYKYEKANNAKAKIRKLCVQMTKHIFDTSWSHNYGNSGRIIKTSDHTTGVRWRVSIKVKNWKMGFPQNIHIRGRIICNLDSCQNPDRQGDAFGNLFSWKWYIFDWVNKFQSSTGVSTY